MAGKISGEMAQMDELSKDFSTASADVASLMSRLDGVTNRIVGSGWEGNAARKFQDLWNGEFKTALKKLDAALNDASREVNNRKTALMQADQ